MQTLNFMAEYPLNGVRRRKVMGAEMPFMKLDGDITETRAGR